MKITPITSFFYVKTNHLIYNLNQFSFKFSNVPSTIYATHQISNPTQPRLPILPTIKLHPQQRHLAFQNLLIDSPHSRIHLKI